MESWVDRSGVTQTSSIYKSSVSVVLRFFLFYSVTNYSSPTNELTQWRQFSFFDFTPIRDPYSGTDEALYSDSRLTAIAPGVDLVFYASGTTIKAFDKDLQVQRHFEAYDKGWTVSRIKYLDGTGLLLTVGELLGQPTTLKLWKLGPDNTQKSHAVVPVSNDGNTQPLTAMAISADFGTIALGFGNGAVIMVRGDMIRDRGHKQRLVYDSSGPVTGLHMTENDSLVYVTTVSQILTVPTSGKNPGRAEKVLDSAAGADVGCSVLENDGRGSDLVVARTSGLQYYSIHGKGPKLDFDVAKKQVYKHGAYLAVATLENSVNRILVVNPEYKYIAFSGALSAASRTMFTQWGQLHVLDTSGMLYRIEEKRISDQIEVLMARNLYSMAVDFAVKHNVPKSELLAIHQRYAQYLYDKGEYAGSMDEYVACLGLDDTATSRVILKFSDSQLVAQLTRYLEEIYDRGLASSQHTGLLLNTYAKQKDTASIERFIETTANSKSYDPEMAIRIFRQSGYHAQAAYLAALHGEHYLAVQIKIELQDYKGALRYAESLSPEDAIRVAIDYGKTLLDVFPNETTALLIKLFTGQYRPKSYDISSHDTAATTAEEEEEGMSSRLTAPVLQSYRAFVSYMGVSEKEQVTVSDDDDESRPQYIPPRPNLIFPAFVSHPYEFIIFLEAYLAEYDRLGSEKDKKEIVCTLFEMYLNLYEQHKDEEWENKAREIGAEYQHYIDPNTMLLLSHLSSFKEGYVMANTYNKEASSGFKTDLLRSCIASGKTEDVVQALHTYGPTEPELYPIALNYFVSSQQVLDETKDEFVATLAKIRQDRLMSPLQVIQALSHSSVATVGLVKDYLLEVIEGEKTSINNNKLLSDSYQKETAAKKSSVDKLREEISVIQATSCNTCKMTLDHPSVHFLCKHSFHQRCLNAVDGENPDCPVCGNDLDALKAIRRAQTDVGERGDLLTAALDSAENKFKVVSDFYGRGAMEKVNYV